MQAPFPSDQAFYRRTKLANWRYAVAVATGSFEITGKSKVEVVNGAFMWIFFALYMAMEETEHLRSRALEEEHLNFYFCEACGRRVTDADIEAGTARNKKLKGIYCTECAAGVMTLETLPLDGEQAKRILQRQSAARKLEPDPESALPRTPRATAHNQGAHVLRNRRDSLRSGARTRHNHALLIAGISIGLVSMAALLWAVGGGMATRQDRTVEGAFSGIPKSLPSSTVMERARNRNHPLAGDSSAVDAQVPPGARSALDAGLSAMASEPGKGGAEPAVSGPAGPRPEGQPGEPGVSRADPSLGDYGNARDAGASIAGSGREPATSTANAKEAQVGTSNPPGNAFEPNTAPAEKGVLEEQKIAQAKAALQAGLDRILAALSAGNIEAAEQRAMEASKRADSGELDFAAGVLPGLTAILRSWEQKDLERLKEQVGKPIRILRVTLNGVEAEG